jgi:predicted NUDIX family phosphoesterase
MSRSPLPSRKTAGAGHAKDIEHVLCVPRVTIFPDGAWHGLVTHGLERVLRTIRAASEYRPRHLVEDDPSQQQVIPYCIVRHPQDDTYLLTQRRRRSSERRLHHLYSLGVGGHVNPGDGEAVDPVIGGLLREWSEEIACPAPATARLVAVLNDDSTPVSRVHLGLVFLIEPEHGGGHVTIRETEKLEGETLGLEAMRRHYLSMESWSQLVYDDLVAGAPERAEHSPMVVELPPAP